MSELIRCQIYPHKGNFSTVSILKGWSPKPCGTFSIFPLVALQSFCQVWLSKFYQHVLCWRPLQEINFKKQKSPTCFFSVVSWEPADQISSQSKRFHTLLIHPKKTHLHKNEVDFVCLQSFFQHFMPLVDHMSSYVDTQKKLEMLNANSNTGVECQEILGKSLLCFARNCPAVVCDRASECCKEKKFQGKESFGSAVKFNSY